MTRLPDTIDIDQEMIKYLFGGEYYHKVMEKGFIGEINMDVDEYHEIVGMFAKEYRFCYERWKRG